MAKHQVPLEGIRPCALNPRAEGLSILVRKGTDRTGYQCVAGTMRLKAQLALTGRAQAVDVESGTTITIHEVGAELLALTPEQEAALERAAAHAVTGAAGGAPPPAR